MRFSLKAELRELEPNSRLAFSFQKEVAGRFFCGTVPLVSTVAAGIQVYAPEGSTYKTTATAENEVGGMPEEAALPDGTTTEGALHPLEGTVIWGLTSNRKQPYENRAKLTATLTTPLGTVLIEATVAAHPNKEEVGCTLTGKAVLER